MPIVIQPYREEHESAVREFNHRLKAATSDVDLVFYPRAAPHWLPRIEGSPLYNQYFVALEDGVVRGAYALKFERFFLSGQGEHAVAYYHHPLSEGIINRSYSSVGGLLLRDALSHEPLLYALGMGGFDRPLPKMLRAMGWQMAPVPFYFKVIHPFRFLRQMQALRGTLWKRCLMDLAAVSGAGWGAIKGTQGVKALIQSRARSVSATQTEEFSEEAESLWLEARDDYRLTSARDVKTLSRLYPASDKELTKLEVSRHGRLIGWVVIGERRKDPKYGTLRVGSIVDCWAHPQDAIPVIRAATRELQEQGMDLIVSNQSHAIWGDALKASGFFTAESNFLFATSKALSTLLGPLPANLSSFHLNRSNGDGLPRNF